MKPEKTRVLLFLILLLAVALRSAALFSLKDTVYYNFLLYDEEVYHHWAVKIAQGDFLYYAIHDFAPLYAWIMGGIYKLLSPDFFYIRIFNMLLGVITCYILYLAGKELKDRWTGLIAAFLACIYKPLIFFNILIHKTSLSVFLFSSAVWLLVSLMKKDSLTKLIFAGFCTGLLINVRSNAIVIIPVIIFFILKKLYKDRKPVKHLSLALFMFILGNTAALAPFGIINYKLTHNFSVMPSGGFNLYIGNNTVNSEPYYRPLPFASSVPSLQATQFIIEAARRTGERLTAKQASAFWTNEAIIVITQSPGKFALKTGRKILALLNRAEVADNHHIQFLNRFINFLKLPLPGIWLILPFGLTSLLFLYSSSETIKALFFVFWAYAFTLVVFFTNVRIRLPLMAIIIPMAAFGMSALYSWMKEKKRKQISKFALAAAGLYLLALVPVHGADDITGHLNTHARALSMAGKSDEALTYWEESSGMDGSYSGYANLSLAGAAAQNGDMRKAHDYLDKIQPSSFTAANKYSMTGDILRLENKEDEAVKAYARSLEINYGQIDVWKKLILLKNKKDKNEAYEAYQQYKYVSSFYQN
jgi:4-amino-4-deoxy-L-arabinose transferase-like glycosyltransferase